ncbi:MAG: hypothetical protein ACK5PQ_03390 [Alphaproteobacteria bacterium]
MLKYSLYFTFLGLVLVMNEDLNASPNNSLYGQTASASEDFRIAGKKTSEGLKKTGINIKEKAKAGIQKVGDGAHYLRQKVHKGQDKADKVDQK